MSEPSPLQMGILITDEDDNEVFKLEPGDPELGVDESIAFLYGFHTAMRNLRRRGFTLPDYELRWLPSKRVVTPEQIKILEEMSQEYTDKINGR